MEDAKADLPDMGAENPGIQKSVKNKLLPAAVGVVGVGALAQNVAAEVNWTPIQGLIEGVATIMPSIGTLAASVVEPLMIFAVVGFVLSIFGAIIYGMESMSKFLR